MTRRDWSCILTKASALGACVDDVARDQRVTKKTVRNAQKSTGIKLRDPRHTDPGNQSYTDVEMLEALDMYDRQGLSMTETARRITAMCGRPVTKNAIIGIHNRVRASLKEDTTGDGTMPARWWERQP